MLLRQIASSLRRHKIAAMIIVIDVAISCAILCNTAFYLRQQIQRVSMPSGLAERELLRLTPMDIAPAADPDTRASADLAELRAIAGVRSASAINTLPLSQIDNSNPVRLTQDQQDPTAQATIYLGSPQLPDTLGLTLTQGRAFTEEHRIDWPSDAAEPPHAPFAIVTRGLADRLFPGQDAVGKTLYVQDDEPTQVIGVVEHLKRGYALGDASTHDDAVILPIQGNYDKFSGSYVLRVDPARRAEVLAAAAAALTRIDRNRVMFNQDSFEQIRASYFRKDIAMTWMLVAICGALLTIALLGIVGIASFWVRQRSRQIGIRRAIGATRLQILQHVQLENLLLSAIGVAVGMFAAYGIGIGLSELYGMPRLPAYYLPLCAAVLVALGQLAVFAPALRASRVSPAIAVRGL